MLGLTLCSFAARKHYQNHIGKAGRELQLGMIEASRVGHTTIRCRLEQSHFGE